MRPQWLWLRLGANDHFPRPTDYIEFENAEQFIPLIENMAVQYRFGKRCCSSIEIWPSKYIIFLTLRQVYYW